MLWKNFRNIKYHEQRFIIEVWAARFGFVILDTNFIGATFLWENFWIECKRQTESHAISVMASASSPFCFNIRYVVAWESGNSTLVQRVHSAEWSLMLCRFHNNFCPLHTSFGQQHSNNFCHLHLVSFILVSFLLVLRDFALFGLIYMVSLLMLC